MTTTAQKVKTYAKLTGIGLVALFVIIFMVQNNDTVSVKFLWYKFAEVRLYTLIFLVGNGGIVVFLICRKIRKVIVEVRQLRQEEKSRKKLVREIEKEVRIAQDSQPKDTQGGP